MRDGASVYILASRPRGAIYVGLTTNLAHRLAQHQATSVSAHTRRYGIKRLVYVEYFADLEEARRREATLKRWRRAWKDQLIEAGNPSWDDVSALHG
jgi:putative endonuclease